MFIKKETVIGIIGNTQGVKIAKRPAKKENSIKGKMLESYLNKSISGLLVIFLGADSQLSKKTNSVSKGTHKPSISEQTWYEIYPPKFVGVLDGSIFWINKVQLWHYFTCNN